MVFPSWQDSQCLSHEFTDCILEQPEIKQNAKITIMINLLALGIIHLSSGPLSLAVLGRPWLPSFYHALKPADKEARITCSGRNKPTGLASLKL
jgi:hypothetical protein